MLSMREQMQRAVLAFVETLDLAKKTPNSDDVKLMLETLENSHHEGVDLNSLVVERREDGEILSAKAKTLSGGVAFDYNFEQEPVSAPAHVFPA